MSEESLKAQHKKKVPLTLEPGGPVIGEAEIQYDPKDKTLYAQMQITEPHIAEFLSTDSPAVIFKKES